MSSPTGGETEMGRKKSFPRADLVLPVEHPQDEEGLTLIPSEGVRPTNTVVRFPEENNASSGRSFDFARWYGVGIDAITYACQGQIERCLAGGSDKLRIATVRSYCTSGLLQFLNYCICI